VLILIQGNRIKISNPYNPQGCIFITAGKRSTACGYGKEAFQAGNIRQALNFVINFGAVALVNFKKNRKIGI
jgi:hypothetical protein